VISALLLLLAIGAGITVYVANQRAQEERRRAEEQLQSEKQRTEVAQKEKEAAEQKAAKEKEEMAKALKYANPYTVLQQGVTITEPDVDESINSYSNLGGPRYSFWVYVLLKNNLYQLDDQTVEYKISVKFPDGHFSNAEKSDSSIEASEEKSLISIRWHMKDDSSMPYGDYSYLIIVDSKIVASKSFSFP
jgi:type II secretory pathway pseudopilin PulG